MPSFEEYLNMVSRYWGRRRWTKEAKEKERKNYEQMREDHDRKRAKGIQDAIKFYAHDKYPLRSSECRTMRNLAIKAYAEGIPFPLDVIQHGIGCPSCQGFFIALRRGDFFSESGLDPKEMALQKKDEEEFAKSIGNGY